jgi:phosphatidate cytidylyltransferase
MLAKRVLVAAILLPIGLVVIFAGGWVFIIAIALILCLAALEFAQLFRSGGHQPGRIILITGVALIALGRGWRDFEFDPLILSLFILGSMTYHLVAYERGRDQAGTDLAITITGGLYIGWIGAYLISLRFQPEGMWWLLLALPSVWLADSGAYFIGRRFGRHKMSKRLSPNKSWEGYFAGIVVGTLGAMLLAILWQTLASTWPTLFEPASTITPSRAGLLGLVLSIVTTLGDLGESMIKRQFGVKDSGKLLPGHGGVFDRIDAWLWAGVIGYFIVALLFT